MSNAAMAIQRGIGKGRDPWGIRKWLSQTEYEDKKGLSMSDVARYSRVPPQVAQETIRGTRNHYRVLEFLEKLGCPDELLYGAANNMGRAA
ncbi:hypothetical protein LJC36_00125 [Desulfovibrio sp. OttesenSCG-928-C14]|nr:hypothetical protein [Desulfovibrio sp. OttesenSCG-928-C14]